MAVGRARARKASLGPRARNTSSRTETSCCSGSMSDDRARAGDELLRQLTSAQQRIQEGSNELSAAVAAEIRSILAVVEAGTPLGAQLHAQLDNVRKWLGALEDREAHARFGGADHLRSHVLTQLRLAHGALEDYLRGNTEVSA